MKKIPLLPLLFCCLPLFAQNSAEVKANFQTQLTVFPQEKLYIHTDKAAYVSGEKIWYSIYLVDAASHIPTSPKSRYVYVDLIDQMGRIVSHSMIRPDKEGLFHNNLALDGDLPEGCYKLRGYTAFMLNRSDYLFEKKIWISNPFAYMVTAKAQFSKTGNRRGSAKISFWNQEGKPIEIESYMAGVDSTENLTAFTKGKEVPIRVTPDKQQTLYVAFEYQNQMHRYYFSVPDLEEAFDVTFHPEGGYLLADTENVVGFKAINTKGLSEPVTVELIEKGGKPVAKAISNALGMGTLTFLAEAGKQYIAQCTIGQNISKQVTLPQARANVYAIHAQWKEDGVHVTARHGKQTPSVNGPLSLLLHVRGQVVYCEQIAPQASVTVDRTLLPSGVVHILLLDQKMNPLSERLVFNMNLGQTKTVITTDKNSYAKRERVMTEVTVTDANGTPVTGYYSVSVTDNSDILPEKDFTIGSVLLLSSELKGYIESPAFYFQEDADRSADLDALLLTQGWRRYNFPAALTGAPETPTVEIEVTQEISGLLKQANGTRAIENGTITLLSSQTGLNAQTVSDRRGRFIFGDIELPDSTQYILQAAKTRGGEMEIVVDSPPLVKAQPFTAPTLLYGSKMNSDYLQKTVAIYNFEKGIRTRQLSPAVITAKTMDVNMNKNEDIMHMVSKIGGLDIVGTGLAIPTFFFTRANTSMMTRNADNEILDQTGRRAARIFVDGMLMELGFDIRSIPPLAVASIEGDPKPRNDAAGGAILITTKPGSDLSSSEMYPDRNIDTYHIFGYKREVEFYSPKYDTPERLSSKQPDLRTTIFWKPNNKVVNGKSTFDFYTADTPATYTIIIEGVTDGGKVIRNEMTIITK